MQSRWQEFWALCSNEDLRRRSLAHGLDTLSTDVLLSLNAVHRDAHPLNVDVPAALSVAHRVANVMPELWPLAANFTLGHNIPQE